jgi:hypothetical protein
VALASAADAAPEAVEAALEAAASAEDAVLEPQAVRDRAMAAAMVRAKAFLTNLTVFIGISS